MIIYNENEFIFIHIPKNSGTAMTNELQKTYSHTTLLEGVVRDGMNIGIVNYLIMK